MAELESSLTDIGWLNQKLTSGRLKGVRANVTHDPATTNHKAANHATTSNHKPANHDTTRANYNPTNHDRTRTNQLIALHDASSNHIQVSPQHKKPLMSYATLILRALESSATGRMTLSEIYHWITTNHAYFRHNGGSWQNSVRHNLSLHRCFTRISRPRNEAGKGAYWRIDPRFVGSNPRGASKNQFTSGAVVIVNNDADVVVKNGSYFEKENSAWSNNELKNELKNYEIIDNGKKMRGGGGGGISGGGYPLEWKVVEGGVGVNGEQYTERHGQYKELQRERHKENKELQRERHKENKEMETEREGDFLGWNNQQDHEEDDLLHGSANHNPLYIQSTPHSTPHFTHLSKPLSDHSNSDSNDYDVDTDPFNTDHFNTSMPSCNFQTPPPSLELPDLEHSMDNIYHSVFHHEKSGDVSLGGGRSSAEHTTTSHMQTNALTTTEDISFKTSLIGVPFDPGRMGGIGEELDGLVDLTDSFKNIFHLEGVVGDGWRGGDEWIFEDRCRDDDDDGSFEEFDWESIIEI